jgi:tetratricopeptide (TPR) repeat protein
VITLRAGQFWDLVPGEIVTVKPRKLWRYSGHPYLSGEIESKRLDVAALGLVPLRLEEKGLWDPEDADWCNKGDQIEDWEKLIIARGPRPEFEMEQVLPGEDPDDPFSDPITKANDLKEAGDHLAAEKILMALCESDLRCLDAHAHLGNLAFDRRPEDAIRHYEIGLGIGELALGNNFDGVLSWTYINNRLFLRCMHGYGLCLWRLEKFEDAARVFEHMLWLNPSDNQGVRFLIEDVRASKPWEDHESAG